MDCERYGESTSARLDGASRGVPGRVVDRHLETWGECRGFEQRSVELNRLPAGREVAARDVALATGLWLAAWQPVRAVGLIARWRLAVPIRLAGAVAV